MASVSTFFTAYSALRGSDRVEAIALVMTDGPSVEPEHRYVVVDEHGVSSLARPDELNLYGVVEDSRALDEDDPDPADVSAD